MSRTTLTMLLALGVCAGGLVFAYVVYAKNFRAAPPEVEEPVSASPEYEETLPGFIAAANMTFNERPTAQSAPRVARDAAQTLLESAPVQLTGNDALSGSRLDSLSDTFERHLAVILSGDYDAWLRFAESKGVTFTAPAGDEGGPPTREKFVSDAAWYARAPINTSRVTLRPRYIDGLEYEYTHYGMTVGGKPFAPYPVPEDPASVGADVYEVIVPMQLRKNRESTPDMNMNVAFGYYWSGARGWIPFSMKSYNDRGGTAGMTRY